MPRRSSPRSLSPDEQHVLNVLLSRPFPGRDELRTQVAHARVVGLACDCGCPSVTLTVDRSAAPAPATGMVVDGVGLDADGNALGVLLFVGDDGYLAELEIYSAAGETVGMPTVQSFALAEWESQGHGGAMLKNPPRGTTGHPV